MGGVSFLNMRGLYRPPRGIIFMYWVQQTIVQQNITILFTSAPLPPPCH